MILADTVAELEEGMGQATCLMACAAAGSRQVEVGLLDVLGTYAVFTAGVWAMIRLATMCVFANLAV
jgi:hypothetical protein